MSTIVTEAAPRGPGGFIALFAVLATGLGEMAVPAAAAPFAYVANTNSGTVSVIDTGANPPVRSGYGHGGEYP
jgi:DNA-binding beta-propeller fold protein YncE